MIPNADGPDTSHWQAFTGKPMPWPLHSLKCSEGANSGDGIPRLDKFAERWHWLRTTNVKYRGAYHWLRSDSTMEAQAANLCRRIDAQGGLRRGEFIQSDWETTSNIAPILHTDETEWRDRVQQHFGRACVITYTSDWVPGFADWRQANPDAPLWYANYNLSDRSTGGWAESARYRADLWQWTSSYTHESIVGGFDMNHVFDWSTLDGLTDQVPPPVPEPVPVPPQGVTMILVRNAEPRQHVDGQTYPAEFIVYELAHGKLRHVSADEFEAYRDRVPFANSLTNVQLDALPVWSERVATLTGTFTGTAV